MAAPPSKTYLRAYHIAVNDTNRAGRPRNGIYDEEEKVQVLGGAAPGGADRGAVPERDAVCEGSPAGRWLVPGAQY